ncbi:MAG TPA: LssY C-terminal domain-containing protein [Phycisphaerales bacterium]|nr:LssY C-terminal domain-containing protein [Phycisphaerales bacterium]HMP35990.1 LssY C-terminal domain-containing protein [Phycisphaerales bacterium]
MPERSPPSSSATEGTFGDPAPPRVRSLHRRALSALAILLAGYVAIAYVLLPVGWKTYARTHPAFENSPRITHTASGIPGDPLNVGVVGSEAALHATMLRAGWYPADPITLESSLRIAEGTVFHRPYDQAPVSDLFLFGRKQDFAYEKPVGDDPRRRNHVRFWRFPRGDAESAAVADAIGGRPAFIGSATYDERVGLSHTTGEITHHIGADVDRERDRLMRDLAGTGDVTEVVVLSGFHRIREGRNGGGDRWITDGDLDIAILGASADAPPIVFDTPRRGVEGASRVRWTRIPATPATDASPPTADQPPPQEAPSQQDRSRGARSRRSTSRRRRAPRGRRSGLPCGSASRPIAARRPRPVTSG